MHARILMARCALVIASIALVGAPGSVFGSAGDARRVEPIATAKIVNGVQTQARPTTGALLSVIGGTNFYQSCTGTLIGCRTFLTAAHCVCSGDTFCNPTPSNHAVFLQHVGVVGVSDVDVHPGYLFGVGNDIAVVTLVAPVQGVSPTPINTTMTPTYGTEGVIAGFGLLGGGDGGSGILRDGGVVTSACGGGEPEPAHVCWAFENPVGLPGEDSNTCSGDSGGPLFIDFGAGEVVAGVTSGGNNADCLASDNSFDTNVYVNAAFVQSIAGADLSKMTCGSISQVGQPSTQVTALAATLFSKEANRCRKELRKQTFQYTTAIMKALRICLDKVNEGGVSGPCPDLVAQSKIDRAIAKASAERIGKKCPMEIVSSISAAAGCSGAVDANDLSICLRAEADLSIQAMLDVAYADDSPTTSIGDATLASCQSSIGSASVKFHKSGLKAFRKCADVQDKGKTGQCLDSKFEQQRSKAAAKVPAGIEKACLDADVATLDGLAAFGGNCGGSPTISALADCLVAEYDLEFASLISLVQAAVSPNETEFTVDPGTDRFRVTVNGVDAVGNDVDVFVKFGALPTPSDFDFESINGGVFDAVEVISPAAGQWFVLIDEYSGSNIPIQLTITTFVP